MYTYLNSCTMGRFFLQYCFEVVVAFFCLFVCFWFVLFCFVFLPIVNHFNATNHSIDDVYLRGIECIHTHIYTPHTPPHTHKQKTSSENGNHIGQQNCVHSDPMALMPISISSVSIFWLALLGLESHF